MAVVATTLPGNSQRPEPAWRVKTKPCEFHLRGTCIFGADRCNFLHVSPPESNDYEIATSTTATTTRPTESVKDESRSRKEVDYEALKKNVLGELQRRNKRTNGSRDSTQSNKSANKVRSPPRSPRRASLLLALQDIIGDDGDDGVDSEEEEQPWIAEEGEDDDAGPSSGVIIHRESTTTTVRPPPIDISPTNSPMDTPHFLPEERSPYREDDTHNLLDLRRFSHASQISTLSALSSSLGLSQFPVPPTYHTFSKEDDDETSRLNDSGFYDSTQPWKSPKPLPLSPPSLMGMRSAFDMLQSPFGDPSSKLNSHSGSGLMSPALVSPIRGSFVPRSPFLGREQLDADTVGQMAGYGAEDEPNHEGDDGNTSTGSLDSPTAYHHQKREEEEQRRREREEAEEELANLERVRDGEVENVGDSSLEMSVQDMDLLREPSTSRPPVNLRIQPYGPEVEHQFNDDEASTPRSVFEDDDDDDYVVEEEAEEDEYEDEVFEEEEDQDDEPASSGHTSLWDDSQRNDETVVFVGQRKSNQPRQPSLEFVEEELQGCSSFADGTRQNPREGDQDEYEDEDEDDFEETARLAYLGDRENDTLNSLYEVYSDIGSEAGDDPRDVEDPERPYTPAGIPLPSPTHSEVHAYALLELFERHKKEERRVSPGDAWAYEPNDSFSSGSHASLKFGFEPPPNPTKDTPAQPERILSPVAIPFLRERVFTPPPPPTPPPVEVPPLPEITQPPAHRTPPQPASTRPTTPRSAPASTAVYEKDKRRTSTMVDPDTPMPSKVITKPKEEPEQVIDTLEVEEKSENLVLKRGLKPLRLSTLLLSNTDAHNIEPPLLTGSGSVFGYTDGAGSHPPSATIDTLLESLTSNLTSNIPTLDDHHDDTTRLLSFGLPSSSHGQDSSSSSSVTPPAPASSTAIPDSQSLSIFNPSSILLSSSPPPVSLPSLPPASRSRPPSLLPSMPSSRSSSTSRKGSGSSSAGPYRRQSRIHYIRHVEPEVPQSAPPVSSNPPSWGASNPNPARVSSSLGFREGQNELEEAEAIPRNRLSRLRSYPPPSPIRIPTSSSSSSRVSGGESPMIRSRSSRTSPLAETESKPEEKAPVQALPPPPPPPPPPVTPSERPALLFAIASDDPEEVQKVLEASQPQPQQSNLPNSSVITANDTVGPQSQSALEFVLTNDGLKNKLDMVKVLLGYGADPSKVGFDAKAGAGAGENDSQLVKKIADLDEATRYYLSRACSAVTKRTANLMQRSTFRPLQRMQYGIVGQDRALEQLFRVLSMHSGNLSKTSQPIVMFLCGPSGHGKSLLAHQFGSLLDVPIHTVNMTTLRSADDLWKSYSISSSEDTVPCTLVEFLANNEGKRCVVVLDEIEKTEDAKALWSLLVPWEFGRCTFEANSRTIDVRNVIWVGTSNIGQDIIFSYHESRHRPDEILSREEYVELMGIVRPRVSDQLGASVLSRVTGILPFVPFTEQEKRAIATEFVMQNERDSELVKELVLSQDKETERRWRGKIIQGAMDDFILSEGARSLYRAVSSHLVDSLDDL